MDSSVAATRATPSSSPGRDATRKGVLVSTEKRKQHRPMDDESLPSGDDQPEFDEPGEDAEESEAAGARPS
jgi:hypothetical protein